MTIQRNVIIKVFDYSRRLISMHITMHITHAFLNVYTSEYLCLEHKGYVSVKPARV